MKKTFLCLILLFSLFVPLVAQETEVNEQYEFFSWEPVAKAKQYGVTIEKYDAAQDIWTDYKEIKTKETQVEVLFTPGVYRVAIASYNVMGRKSKNSEWIQFKILEENIPYLYENAFSKSEEWGLPVIHISKNSDNTILVKGRNIFSPRTEFFLVARDTNKEEKLKILSRNSKEYSVVLSYESSRLQTGYYSLLVRNPGNNTASVELLLLDDSPITIRPASGFETDINYNVNSLQLSTEETVSFSITGENINSLTGFTLEPANSLNAYPFETELARQTVKLEAEEFVSDNASSATVSLHCNNRELYNGYYNLVARNWDGKSSKFLLLVKKPFQNDYTKNVRLLKTKYDKRRDVVNLTLQDPVFTSDKSYTLVSEYEEEKDSNTRIPLSLSKSGKKLTGKLMPEQLSFQRYALLIEDENGSNVIWCSIDDSLKLKMNKMTQSEVDQAFLRPQEKSSQQTAALQEEGSIVFVDNKIQMLKRLPPFFSNFRVDLSFAKDATPAIGLELDLFNVRFASMAMGYQYRTGKEAIHNTLYSVVRFAIPSNYFSPYLGLGIGYNLFPRPEEKNVKKEDFYGIAQLGANIFTVLDVRYNLFLNDIFTDQHYFTESIAFGFSFPLRSYKFKRKVISLEAQISMPQNITGTSLFEPSMNVDSLVILQGSSVSGFEGYDKIHRVSFATSVTQIEEAAFRNCKNLDTIIFDDRFGEGGLPLTIKANAFANDDQVDIVYLPVRTKVVEANAFAGWTNGQIIVLDWDKDDPEERDLQGLINTSATVHYKNGDLFHGDFKNPLENQDNWVKLDSLNVSNVSVYYEDQYILGMRVKGLGKKYLRTELNLWINQESPQEALDYLKNAQGIKFKVQGDGNTHDFIITTKEGGYFYYRFKTKEDAVTLVEIPFKKMKKYSYSSQKKLDLENIKMFCIMPMCKNEWNEVSFFDFEVIQ